MDKGLSGSRNHARPGLDQAMSAVHEGDTLVVPKLDRLARSVPDARHIADQLEAKGVKLALGQNTYDPADPMGKMFFNILATFAEFEADLIRMRTREGMAVARAKGKLQGKQPKLSDKQQKELCRMHASGDYSIGDLAEVFAVSRADRLQGARTGRPTLTFHCRSYLTNNRPLTYKQPMEFDWDDAKNNGCFHRRGFDFAYAIRTFVDPHRTIEQDRRRDYGENRTGSSA